MPHLANSRHLWRVWRANARASAVREMAFRTNFFLGLIRQLMWFGIFIIFIDVIFQNTESLAGWNQSQMLLILALSRMIEGIMNTLFVQNWMNFTRTVNNGEFDFHLLRPVPTQFYTGFRHLNIGDFGNAAIGLGLLIYALIQMAYRPTLINLGAFLFLAFLGITVYYTLLVIVASLVFKLERLESLWGFNSLFSEPLTVPFDVFPSGARIALTYLIPLAMVVFIPAQSITGRLQLWQAAVALALTGVFLTIANLTWSAGLKKYSSASS